MKHFGGSKSWAQTSLFWSVATFVNAEQQKLFWNSCVLRKRKCRVGKFKMKYTFWIFILHFQVWELKKNYVAFLYPIFRHTLNITTKILSDLAEVFLCSWWEVLTESMEFNSEFGLPVTDSKSLLIISNNLYGHLVMESGKAFIIDVNK